VSVTEIAIPQARRHPLPPRLSPLRRLRRIVIIGLCLCSVPILISYVTTMTRPSNATFTINTFEWLRDHGAAGVAVQAEDIYYSLNAPSTGGPGIKKLAIKHPAAAATIHPPDVAPLIQPPLRGEGVWVPSETWTGANGPVQITQFRSDPNYPSMVAGVAWIDTSRTTVTLNPGRLEPSVTLPRGPMEVAPASRGRLLATFNSAFKLADSGGGFAVNGHTYAPMKAGMATLIGYANGKLDIEAWQGGPDIPAGVSFARQNLPLIVANGAPNPNLSDGPAWGVTVGNAIRVWRSGIGVDRNEILIRAGAVRAMQLDINSFWVSFITYAQPDAGSPSNLLPDMTRTAYRYLTPEDRDFFAVYAR
jgi:hypothetical protein